jgi:hypothetical protein
MDSFGATVSAKSPKNRNDRPLIRDHNRLPHGPTISRTNPVGRSTHDPTVPGRMLFRPLRVSWAPSLGLRPKTMNPVRFLMRPIAVSRLRRTPSLRSNSQIVKGKPVERRGRKATGLRVDTHDSGVANGAMENCRYAGRSRFSHASGASPRALRRHSCQAQIAPTILTIVGIWRNREGSR